jgi:osmotically-inducible protein OsmY
MTDKDLRRDVTDALDTDPCIDGGDIGVAVCDGVVTLTGHVGSYAEKVEVERAMRRVRGVRAIALNVAIRDPAAKQISDGQIAARAIAIIDWYARIPSGVLMVKVADGWITLTGTVKHPYQAMAAEAAVQRLSGVAGVSNLIAVAPRVPVPVSREGVVEALRRHTLFEADAIRVSVADDRVTLEGTVTALAERDAAERAAWAVPGVRSVEDRITVA